MENLLLCQKYWIAATLLQFFFEKKLDQIFLQDSLKFLESPAT